MRLRDPQMLHLYYKLAGVCGNKKRKIVTLSSREYILPMYRFLLFAFLLSVTYLLVPTQEAYSAEDKKEKCSTHKTFVFEVTQPHFQFTAQTRDHLKRQLLAIPGIQKVRICNTTRTILIEFTPSKFQQGAPYLLTFLQRAGFPVRLRQRKDTAPRPGLIALNFPR